MLTNATSKAGQRLIMTYYSAKCMIVLGQLSTVGKARLQTVITVMVKKISFN